MKHIHFSELSNYDDNNSFVVAGISPETTIEEAEQFFHETNFLEPDVHIIDILRLDDNVLGDEGRTDLVFLLNKFGCNPMVRLMFRQGGLGVMWTEDFKYNYAKDYCSAV